MEPGSTCPVTYMAGFLIGMGSVIIPVMTIASDANGNSHKLHHSLLDSGRHELHSTCELGVLSSGP